MSDPRKNTADQWIGLLHVMRSAAEKTDTGGGGDDPGNGGGDPGNGGGDPGSGGGADPGNGSADPGSGSGSPGTGDVGTNPGTGGSGTGAADNGGIDGVGSATTETRNGQTVTIVTLDETKLEERLAAEEPGAVVTIPVNTHSEAVISELNGQMVKTMEASEAILEIRTDRASYTLPAKQIRIDAISEQIGTEIALRDIKVRIEIAEPPAETVRVVESAAADGSFALVVPPIEFTVRAVH